MHSNYFSKTVIQFSYIASSHISVRTLEGKCLAASLMVSFFFYGLSLYGITQSVTLASYFPPIFLMHGYSQVATTFTYKSVSPLSYYTPIQYITKTIPYLSTLPNYTLS